MDKSVKLRLAELQAEIHSRYQDFENGQIAIKEDIERLKRTIEIEDQKYKHIALRYQEHPIIKFLSKFGLFKELPYIESFNLSSLLPASEDNKIMSSNNPEAGNKD